MPDMREQMPTLSIVMASFNNGHLLPQAVQSVLAQDKSDWELIIVDDASSDDSVKIAQQFAADDSRIRVFVNTKNMGVGFTKRRAVSECHGALVGILDPDDALTPDAIAVMIQEHSSNRDTVLCWSEYLQCDEQMRPVAKSSSQFQGDAELGYISATPGDIHAFWTFKHEAYEKTAGFNSRLRLAEDQDLFYKLEEVGATRHIPNALYHYRHHPGSISIGDKTAAAFAMHLLVMFETLARRRHKIDEVTWKNQYMCVHSHYCRFIDWGAPKVDYLTTAWLAWKGAGMFRDSQLSIALVKRLCRIGRRSSQAKIR